MRKVRTWVAGAIVLASVLGCFGGRTATTRIRHPLHSGAVETNRIALSYAAAESTYALPTGSLDDEATLVRLDPSAVCFEVKLRSLAEEAGRYADPAAWEMHVAWAEDAASAEAPAVFPRGVETAAFAGQRPEQQQTGSTTECVAHDSQTQACTRWETRPVYTTVYVPATIHVVTGAAGVCFANQGRITPATPKIALELTGPDSQELTFEWEFDLSGAPAQQPARQVASR